MVFYILLIVVVSCVDISEACVERCVCHSLMIRGTRLKTLSCPKRDFTEFPTGIDNTTQFVRLEGNRISDIPHNLSQLVPDLQRIDMSDNRVTRLRSRIFAGLKNLNAVNLVNNKIERIEDRIFEGSESKSMNLKLRGNRIRNINEDAFRGLYANSEIDLRGNQLERLYPNTLNGVRIMTLDLSHNKLEGLPDQLFENQDQLYFLRLGQNNISSLSRRVFRGLPSLHTLDLTSNNLMELPNDLFEKNREPAINLILESNQFSSPPMLDQHAKVTVSLENNPIVCDCNLKRLLSNTSYKVVVKDLYKVVCVNDTRYVTTVLETIDCRTTTPPPTTTTHAPTTIITLSTPITPHNTTTNRTHHITTTTTTTSTTTNNTSTTNATTSSTTTNNTTSQHMTPSTLSSSSTTFKHVVREFTTPFRRPGIKINPGINRLTVLVSSMITVVFVVMVGIFCYINRQRIINRMRRPFKLYENLTLGSKRRYQQKRSVYLCGIS